MAIPHDIPPLHCGKCGYDVRGLPEAVCPECGGDLKAVGVATPDEPNGWYFAMLAFNYSVLFAWLYPIVCLVLAVLLLIVLGSEKNNWLSRLEPVPTMWVLGSIGLSIFSLGLWLIWLGWAARRREARSAAWQQWLQSRPDAEEV